MEGEGDPCHRDDVNGRCVVVDRPHPNHPFTVPHPTVYETAQATQKKIPTVEILMDEKSMFARRRSSLFIPSYESICVGFWRFPKFPMEFFWK